MNCLTKRTGYLYRVVGAMVARWFSVQNAPKVVGSVSPHTLPLRRASSNKHSDPHAARNLFAILLECSALCGHAYEETMARTTVLHRCDGNRMFFCSGNAVHHLVGSYLALGTTIVLTRVNDFRE